VLLTLARYGTQPPISVDANSVDRLAEVVATRATARDVSALVNASWALAVLGHATSQGATRVTRATGAALDAAVAAGTAPARLLRKAYLAQLFLESVGGDLPLGNEAAAAAATDSAMAQWPSESAESVRQRYVRFLEVMGVPHKTLKPAANGRLRVHIALIRTADQARRPTLHIIERLSL
jgi:hypothetical protein